MAKINKENELELRRLIYGQSGIIVVSTTNFEEMIKDIEMVRSTLTIDGFIFKPDFADSKKLKEFNEADWRAMFAQYSLTYGWSNEFEAMTGESPIDTLSAYMTVAPEQKVDIDIQSRSIGHEFKVVPIGHYREVCRDIASSKTVLREQQIRIINLMPIEDIETVFNSLKFTIKETEILFIKRLVEAGSSKFSFKDPDQIIRFLVSNFRSNGEQITGQIDKGILKNVQLKIPTSFKKKIWKDIDKMRHDSVKKMHKYSQFWKRIFKQIKFTTDARLEKRFSKAFDIKQNLYTHNYIAPNSDIEKLKAQGQMDVALLHELQNPGQMLRNLLQYLRYKKGDKFASKSKKESWSMADAFAAGSSTVKKSAKKVLQSEEFYNALLKTNPKLLWQVMGMLDEKNTKIFESRNIKIMNGVKIRYSIPLPGVYPDMAKIVRKHIKNAIKQIKREENSTLGNIYIDKSVEKYSMQYSGRSDSSLSMSGTYLAPGTRINIDEIIPPEKQDKYILRIGLAWKGQSCDIDLSMNVENYGAVFYGNNSLVKDDDVIIASSGDITSCNNNIFSTELIDVDLKLFKKHGFSRMFNSAIMYSGATFDKYEAYWFMTVMKKKDRVKPGARVKIQLDDMHYATQITDESKGMIGLFMDINEGYVEVLNIPMEHRDRGMNASKASKAFKEAIENMPVRQTIEEALHMSINKQQFVDDIEFADVIITDVEPDAELIKEGAVVLNPGVDNIKLQEIVF